MGGCSSINGMIYMRGQSKDYDHWRQLGNLGWGWDDEPPAGTSSSMASVEHGQRRAWSSSSMVVVEHGDILKCNEHVIITTIIILIL